MGSIGADPTNKYLALWQSMHRSIAIGSMDARMGININIDTS
eukprot:SAG11_NODE_1140_length_5709_cov_11.137611_2_plen_42_part_00